MNYPTKNQLNNTKTTFFSLKWKLIIALSLVIIAVNFGITTLAIKSYQHDFDTQRASATIRNKHEISALLQNSINQLQQLHSVISSLQGMQLPLKNMQTGLLKNTFENHWLSMEADWGLSRIEFFNHENKSIAKWPEQAMNPALQFQINLWVKQVNKTETPVSAISCIESCSQYRIIPLLSQGNKNGVIVLSVSLADTIINFKQITGYDIGIISKPSPNTDSPMQQMLLLKNWGYRIASLTSSTDKKKIIHSFSEQFTDIEQIENGKIIQFGEHYYELVSIPLDTAKGNLILVLTDITLEKFHMNNNFQNLVIASFLGLFLSEFLLFTLLAALIRRLNRTTLALPLLAIGGYSQARETISTDTYTHAVSDEIDLLNDSAVRLSYQLEELTFKEKKHRIDNLQKVKDIKKEHDFNQKILDTAQVIILTLDKNSLILEINKFGEQLTGFSNAELTGKSFADLHSDNSLISKPLFKENNLSHILNGSLNQYKHEDILICKNGNTRNIIWMHSQLKTDQSDEPKVLSAGLDISDRKEVENQLGWLADHDPLTELYNRRRFESELKQSLHWTQRYNREGALLYLDLDNFKDINDSSGHQAGDAILRSVASTLMQLTRNTDVLGHPIAGRLGGDEFAIIMKDTDKIGAKNLADRIIDAIHKINHSENNIHHVLGCSIGIAMFPHPELSVAELLSNADHAMYQAKITGRNKAALFSIDNSYRAETQHRVYWKDKIEHALKADRFVLYFQPILNIKSKIISHYEVLIRMLDDNNEIIPPANFIGIAEKLGLIHSIDNFVLRQAIYRQAELHKQGYDITLALNLSGKAFDDPHLVGNIEQTINESGATPHKIIFEITETAAVSDISAAGNMMTQIKALGCHFALDDFGVGFSSFYYLKELPVDLVKIDGSFISQLPFNTDNQVLVKALSEVASGFNKLTVAEFVDSKETLEILESYQVTYAQGFFIGKPSPNIPIDPPDLSS